VRSLAPQIEQCPAQQHAQGQAGAHKRHQRNRRAVVALIQGLGQRLHITRHTGTVLGQGQLIEAFMGVGRRMLLADHFGVMALLGLDQAFFFLHVGDFNLHGTQ